ncbi:MAG: hypothetical protein O3B09_01770 [Proteobacteria bacterium]|nr:hypothetical protein [Pseudomonadota bacterium]
MSKNENNNGTQNPKTNPFDILRESIQTGRVPKSIADGFCATGAIAAGSVVTSPLSNIMNSI